MASKDNTDTFSDHIMNAIAEIKNSKKCTDNKSITEFIQKNHSTNAILTSSRKLLKKLSKIKRL